MFRKRDTHIHFVGIGGIGMSGIAEVLLNFGYHVSGTDLRESEVVSKLRGLGAHVFIGHDGAHIGDADVVVVSSAIKAGNPEVDAARTRKIPVIPRAEMLAELMRLKQGLCIAGSHGKTTTTSLVASVLHEAGLDPTVVIGGKLNMFDSNARLGQGDLLVAEADESDGSFLVLTPTLAVITNIDTEHLDHYGDLETLLDAFVGFANRVPFYGMSVVCADDANVRRIIPRLTKRFVTYGIEDRAPADLPVDYVAHDVEYIDGKTRFLVRVRGEEHGVYELGMPGEHNVLNALATIAMCDEQQVHPAITHKALAEFGGVQRRFSHRGDVGGVTVIDDYGHHPTEIQATLSGARCRYRDRRIVAVVQPHRYSRVRDSLDDFPGSLDEADAVVVTEVYAAGESPIEGISGRSLAERIRARRDGRTVLHQPDFDALTGTITELAAPGDVIITLGAGSITQVSFALLDALAEAS